jgi:anti-sigma regulatory factor (Ser/Thr protein kinase)
MNEAVWPRRQPPAAGPDAAPVGRWTPASPAEVTAARRELAASVEGRAWPPGGAETLETLLLTFEELVSNAVRHGRAPVEVIVTAEGPGWLVAVSDAAAERRPVPAVDREADQGGLGLYLVARTSVAHGWALAGNRKVVWAHVESEPSTTPTGRTPPPRPRGQNIGNRHLA